MTADENGDTVPDEEADSDAEELTPTGRKKRKPGAVNHLKGKQPSDVLDWVRANTEICPKTLLEDLADQCTAAVGFKVTSHNMRHVLNTHEILWKDRTGKRSTVKLDTLRRKIDLQNQIIDVLTEKVDSLIVEVASLNLWRKKHGTMQAFPTTPQPAPAALPVAPWPDPVPAAQAAPPQPEAPAPSPPGAVIPIPPSHTPPPAQGQPGSTIPFTLLDPPDGQAAAGG